MRQYFLPKDYTTEPTVKISGKDFHYLKDVLRLKIGDSFSGLNKTGDSFKLLILEEKENCLILKSDKILRNKEYQSITINLFQCLPKAKKMDLIVRQATETGISKIVPVISTNTIVKLNDKTASKLDRWNRIVKEAIQQSGTTTYPVIEVPVQFSELKNASSGLKLFFHQEPLRENTLFNYLQIGHKQVKLSSINILIGPEGGFTDKEITDLYSYGFKPIYLGKEVLRVETAALYAIASIKTLLLGIKYQEEI